MNNPSIEELQDETRFELLTKLSHPEIKEFVIEQLGKGGILVRSFMIYQLGMIILGIFFFTRSIVLLFQGVSEPFYYSMAALVFCFSLLIIFHELLHGAAIKLSGAKKVTYGAYFKKFIFYAEADKHVMNRLQFTFIALTPLIVVKLITVVTGFFILSHPALYFTIFVMCAHSLFCAGDIGLLSIFYADTEVEMYTFDVKEEKTSYYFKKLK